MPRSARAIVPGVVYHLISRFVAREFFMNSELDRRYYLSLLGKALEQVTWRCLGYALMSNHIHLALVAGHEPLAAWLRKVHSPFARATNQARQRIGSMFVRGPKDILVPDSGVGAILGYIHNNPVRARVAAEACETTWTSHRAYLGTAPVPRWLHVSEGLARSGVAGADAFDALVRASSKHPVLGHVQSDEHLEELVDAYERAKIAAYEKPDVRPVVEASEIVEVVAHQLDINVSQLRSRRRGQTERLGQGSVIACASRLGCRTLEIAEALGITPQAVTKVLRAGVGDEVDAFVGERVMCQLVPGGRPAMPVAA